MTTALQDRILDALDDAPLGRVIPNVDEDRFEFHGQIATVQWLVARTGKSESAIRQAVLSLFDDGLVIISTGRDPNINNHRRWFVTAQNEIGE